VQHKYKGEEVDFVESYFFPSADSYLEQLAQRRQQQKEQQQRRQQPEPQRQQQPLARQ
jgi:hypothetical protein